MRGGVPNGIAAAVTHLHGDHFGGLPFLVLDGKFRGRTTDLTVLGPPGTGERPGTGHGGGVPGFSGVTGASRCTSWSTRTGGGCATCRVHLFLCEDCSPTPVR